MNGHQKECCYRSRKKPINSMTDTLHQSKLQKFSEMQQERAVMQVRRKYKRYSKQKMTYLGLIAYVIQNAPEKRLTFHKLMNALTNFVDGDRKGLENNIRVCLSSNNCFVKVPINPEFPNAKRNFWKVDDRKITPKILRRHFRGLCDVFPDLYENMEILSENRATHQHSEAEKFTSPFSIESLLQRESSASVRYSPVGLHDCATKNFENKFIGHANGDCGLLCKRKTRDWPNQTAYVNFCGSYSHFCFPTFPTWQFEPNERWMQSPIELPKRMRSVSVPYFTEHESFRYFTSNALSWAYM